MRPRPVPGRDLARPESWTPLDLQINDATKRRVANAGFLIELSELAPYPFLHRPIAPDDYRATIVISRD